MGAHIEVVGLRLMRAQWQIDQGKACGCRGHDEYCPCQNVERKSWFVEQRMSWIAETLRVFGFINRAHIERKFGVSQPQAALDLRLFQERHPSAMTYDKSAKRYVASETPT